jgi:DNA primase
MFKSVDPEQLLDRLGIRYDRRGTALWASCPHPDHSDSTPSWRIIVEEENPKFGQHRCYGCGFGGWPVHLVEAALGCTRVEAVEWLKDIEQDPPLPLSVAIDYQRGLSPVFRLPLGVNAWEPLHQWEPEPREYAVKRGLLDWQVQRWQVVYAPVGYDGVRNRLSGRIVFPVRDVGGKLIGYTGRSYTGSELRYKEPQKAEGADLGSVFGAEHWPKRRKVVAVTEGALDALAIERAFPYSLPIGGIYGSQLHQGHIARLSTFEHVLMCTDPDKAGNAVAQALDEQLRRWVQVVRVEIPKGQDCASMPTAELRLAVDSGLRVVHQDRDRHEVEAGSTGRRRRTQVRLAR